MEKKWSLVSVGFKIATVILEISILTTLILVSIFMDQKKWLGILLCLCGLAICSFGVFLTFNRKLIVFDDKLIIKNVLSIYIPFENITEIDIKDLNKKLCNMYIKTLQSEYTPLGYMGLKGNNKQKTEEILKEVIEVIKGN